MDGARAGLTLATAARGRHHGDMISDRSTFDRLFRSHPRSVGESYGEHAGIAGRFGVEMIAGGFACLVHAVVPAWFERTGSSIIKRLYGRMKARQPAFAEKRPAFAEPEWQLEYEI